MSSIEVKNFKVEKNTPIAASYNVLLDVNLKRKKNLPFECTGFVSE